MKLGVADLLADGSPEAVAQVRELGFNATAWRLPDLAIARDQDRLLDIRDTLEAEEVELRQLLPPDPVNLVSPDSARRDEGVHVFSELLAAARILGAESVLVRPGSVSPAGPRAPHPENHTPATRERLIESLCRIIPLAEQSGVFLALEGHVLSPLPTPKAVREVLDRVASPWLRFNADPVNFIGTLDQVFDNTALIDELFDLLGGETLTAHLKDVTVTDRAVLHIEECVPGQGYLDHETFLRRFEACCPRGTVLIEHLPVERVPEARRAVLEFAHRAGLEFQKS